jgi:hypothetical protein
MIVSKAMTVLFIVKKKKMLHYTSVPKVAVPILILTHDLQQNYVKMMIYKHRTK